LNGRHVSNDSRDEAPGLDDEEEYTSSDSMLLLSDNVVVFEKGEVEEVLVLVTGWIVR